MRVFKDELDRDRAAYATCDIRVVDGPDLLHTYPCQVQMQALHKTMLGCIQVGVHR